MQKEDCGSGLRYVRETQDATLKLELFQKLSVSLAQLWTRMGSSWVEIRSCVSDIRFGLT